MGIWVHWHVQAWACSGVEDKKSHPGSHPPGACKWAAAGTVDWPHDFCVPWQEGNPVSLWRGLHLHQETLCSWHTSLEVCQKGTEHLGRLEPFDSSRPSSAYERKVACGWCIGVGAWCLRSWLGIKSQQTTWEVFWEMAISWSQGCRSKSLHLRRRREGQRCFRVTGRPERRHWWQFYPGWCRQFQCCWQTVDCYR